MKVFLHPSPRLRRGYLLLSGLLLGACVTFPTGVGAVVEWIAAVPAALAVFSLIAEEKIRYFRVWGLGFLFCAAEYFVNYHWFIRMYPLDFTGMSRAAALVVVLLGWWGLSALAALMGGVCFAVTVALGRTSLCRRMPVLVPFVAGAAFTLFEWTQTQTWMGVPWGRLALGQLAGNFTLTVMPARLFGSYLITFLLISVSYLLALGLSGGKLRARALLALGLAATDLAAGTLLFFLPEPAAEPVTVAAVQGNVNSRDKWDASSSRITDERYRKYTLEAVARGAQIVVYPETAYPYYVSEGGAYDTEFSVFAGECGAAIAAGCFTYEGEGQYNVLRFYTPEGYVGFAAKRHLVPFGEYLPWRGFFETFLKPLTELAMLSDDLTPTADANVTELSGIPCGTMICFDSIYETLALRSTRAGAQILLLATNDSWFLDSRAVYMHNAQARLRAIENCRPVVRAANTGVSSLIDSRGRVTELLPPLVEGVVVGTVTPSCAVTLYSVVGNLFVVLCAAFAFGLAAAEGVRRFREKSTGDSEKKSKNS